MLDHWSVLAHSLVKGGAHAEAAKMGLVSKLSLLDTGDMDESISLMSVVVAPAFPQPLTRTCRCC